MILENVAFVILVVTTFMNCGYHVYIHFNAYPILPHVGQAEFASYLKAYEDRLMIPLVLPYTLSMVSAFFLILAPPAGIEPLWVILALALNVPVAVVTALVATPVYNQMKAAGTAEPALLNRLLRINLYRVLLTLLSGVVVAFMLWVVLTM